MKSLGEDVDASINNMEFPWDFAFSAPLSDFFLSGWELGNEIEARCHILG